MDLVSDKLENDEELELGLGTREYKWGMGMIMAMRKCGSVNGNGCGNV